MLLIHVSCFILKYIASAVFCKPLSASIECLCRSVNRDHTCLKINKEDHELLLYTIVLVLLGYLFLEFKNGC